MEYLYVEEFTEAVIKAYERGVNKYAKDFDFVQRERDRLRELSDKQAKEIENLKKLIEANHTALD